MLNPKTIHQLSEILGSDRLKKNVSLASHTTFGIGGPAQLFYKAKTSKELIRVIKAARELKIPYFILGGGSNILVADRGLVGLTIKIQNSKFKVQNYRIIAEAGTPLAKVVKAAQEHSLSGLECCIGIPGTVGGAVAGNAGDKNQWISQCIKSVTILDKSGKIINLKKDNCQFGYRTSCFKDNPSKIILEAILELKKENSKTIKEKTKQFLEAKGNQPKEKSAGSIFKNPANDSAGRLIDAAGLKGKKVGEAQISPQHANFIINLGRAKAKDVLTLIRLAQNEVKEKFGVELELEIKLIGFKRKEIENIIN